MKQSRATSFIKSLVSTATGFLVAMAANAIVLPFFGWSPTLSENLVLTTIYTVISIGRGYVLERIFEAAGWRVRMSAFALAVLAERQRQIAVEGYDDHHDDRHHSSELALASAAYLADDELLWPWDDGFKPEGFGPRRRYVKGAALALAAGEHLDRNRKRKSPLTQPQPLPDDVARRAFPDKGGHNDWPSQVTVRPGPPPASNPRSTS